MIDIWIKYCQEQLNNPNFYPWKFERVGNAIIAFGGECPLITRGKRKGQPNYRKADNKQSVVIPLNLKGE